MARLLTDSGLKPGQWQEVVDFYHAVEHLEEAGVQCKRWSSVEAGRRRTRTEMTF